MKKPSIKERILVQLMLGISIILGVFPPLIMFLVTKNGFYFHEASRKALNFHLTIFPLFILSSFFPPWTKYALWGIETVIIFYAILQIAFQRPYQYPAIPYIKRKKYR